MLSASIIFHTRSYDSQKSGMTDMKKIIAPNEGVLSFVHNK